MMQGSASHRTFQVLDAPYDEANLASPDSFPVIHEHSNMRPNTGSDKGRKNQVGVAHFHLSPGQPTSATTSAIEQTRDPALPLRGLQTARPHYPSNRDNTPMALAPLAFTGQPHPYRSTAVQAPLPLAGPIASTGSEYGQRSSSAAAIPSPASSGFYAASQSGRSVSEAPLDAYGATQYGYLPVYQVFPHPSIVSMRERDTMTCTHAAYGSRPERSIVHADKERETRKVTCELCGLSFTGEYARGNFQRHLRTAHSSTSYICEAESCHKTFNRQDYRLNHYRKYHPEMDVRPRVPRKMGSSLPLSVTQSSQDHV